MSSTNSNESNMGQVPSQMSPTGRLKIKVPHWLVQVRIFDNAYKHIAHLNEFKQVDDSVNCYEAEAKLKPGIYEVEVYFANKTERK